MHDNESDADDLSDTSISSGTSSTACSGLSNKKLLKKCEAKQEILDGINEKEDEYLKVQKEIREMPFNEREKLKNKMGLKLYNQIMLGNQQKRKDNARIKRTFKRENKNRPQEISSKKKVSRNVNLQTSKKPISRDPRFDDLSGEFSEQIFKRNYSFVEEFKKKDKEVIFKALSKEKNPEKKMKLKTLLASMNQKESDEIRKENQRKRIEHQKTKNKVLVREGGKPFYLKRSDQKKIELAEKYQELKKSGKLDNYLKKKRKKNASKEKKTLPFCLTSKPL